MAKTTYYYSSVRTLNPSSNFDSGNSVIGTARIEATRSSPTDKNVTLKLDTRIGFSKKNTATYDKHTYSVQVQVGSSKYSYSGTYTVLNDNSGVAGTLTNEDETTAYDVQKLTDSEKVSWYSTDSLTVKVIFKQDGKQVTTSTSTLEMPTYSSSSGGGDSGGTTTVGENSITSFSVSPSTVAPGQNITFTAKASIGSNNNIEAYQIFVGNESLNIWDTNSTSFEETVSAPNSEGDYTYKITVKSFVTKNWSDIKTTKLTVRHIVPTITDASISPDSIPNTSSKSITLSVTTNTGYYKYWKNEETIKTTSSSSSVSISVNSNDKIKVQAYNPANDTLSAIKTFTVRGYTPVTIDSININPQIIKDNITSPDLAKIVSGSVNYSGPVSSRRWEYRASSDGSNFSEWKSLGINSSNFSNVNMGEKLNKGDYYQFRVYIESADDYDYSSNSEIYQIPALPSAATITKVIPKANPIDGYETITQDGKIYYGSGLFLTWTNPTVSDSQVPISDVELIYSYRSSSSTSFGEIKTAPITYHTYLENGTSYTFNKIFPYNATLPTGTTGSGGGADLEVPSLYTTMIGIRVIDQLGQINETISNTFYYKSESPSFGGNITLSQKSFRPFTCNIDETFHLGSSVGYSNSQDTLYYDINCYINDRKVTIPIIEKIPISTTAFNSAASDAILYSDNNVTIKKYSSTIIWYIIKNSYLKTLLLAETGLRSPKNNLSAIYNDDFLDVVYKVSVRDDFDSRSTVYNSDTFSINFIEAPMLSNNNYLDIGVNRYLKSLNPFYDNSIIIATPESTNNNRIVNPGEAVIFKFKRAKDYNGADYTSTMLGDVTQYNIYISRNDEKVTSNYENLTYTLLKTYSIEELKKALPSSSTDEYYYLEYPLQSYQESKFITFRMEAVDSKGMKSEYLYSNTYLVPCRAQPMDFYLRTVTLNDNTNAGVTLKFKTRVNDFGASIFVNNNYDYNDYPNYERNYTVNNNTFTRKGEVIFEGCLDGNFNNTGTTNLNGTNYNNYFTTTINLIPYLIDKKYPDIFGFEEELFQPILLPETWQEGGKLKTDIKKIFFKTTYKIAYGFKDLEATDYDKYLYISSTSVPYSYYEDSPTVSYRNHQVGINTKDFSPNNAEGQQEVLIIQDNGSYNLVVFKGAEQKIILNLTSRSFYTLDSNEKVINEVNFGESFVNGMTIDSGTW